MKTFIKKKKRCMGKKKESNKMPDIGIATQKDKNNIQLPN